MRRAAGLVAAALAALVGATPAASAVRPVLPDLDQVTPSRLSVVAEGGGWRLAFASAVENRGAGRLTVVGRRRSTAVPEMTAEQLVDLRDDASRRVTAQRRIPNVGRLRFVHSSDHRHWHLLRFMTYELRRAGDGRLVAPDRKTGFCLGDRYRFADASVAGVPGARDFDPDCGLDRPALRRVVEGISPGYGDDYRPVLEGQYVDVTRVRSGRYVLVHRVDRARRLLDADRANDAASVLLSLHRRPGRAPEVTVLRRCSRRPTCG